MTAPIPQSVDSTIGRTSTAPFITVIFARAPTTTDMHYLVGQRWINTADTNAEWFLLNFTASAGVVSAHWVQLGSGSGTTETLTGNTGGAVTVDGSNNINVLGATATGIAFSGSGSTLTGTLSAIPNSALANSSVTLTAAGGMSISGSPVSLGGTATITAPGGRCNFLVYMTTALSNVTGDGTEYQVIFDTEVFDAGSNFNLGTSVFTAPVTGVYMFTTSIMTTGWTDPVYATVTKIVTTNRRYESEIGDPYTITDTATYETQVTCIANMTAGHTAHVQISVFSGAKTVGIGAENTPGATSDTVTRFAGFLIA